MFLVQNGMLFRINGSNEKKLGFNIRVVGFSSFCMFPHIFNGSISFSFPQGNSTVVGDPCIVLPQMKLKDPGDIFFFQEKLHRFLGMRDFSKETFCFA